MGVWSSGVSTNVFDPTGYDKKVLRQAYGLGDKFVVFYHGSLGASLCNAKMRGIFDSISSIELLKSRYPDLILFLLGDSRSFDTLNKIIVDCGVQGRVILHDKVPYEEVPKYIAMSDVCLVPIPNLPIWRNQCPLKLLEYASMGKTIIATDITAHRSVLGSSNTVVFIPSSKSQAIADGISEVYQNKLKLAVSAMSERSIIEERFSWLQVATDFERYLLSLN